MTQSHGFLKLENEGCRQHDAVDVSQRDKLYEETTLYRLIDFISITNIIYVVKKGEMRRQLCILR